jgi:hypothetical protein
MPDRAGAGSLNGHLCMIVADESVMKGIDVRPAPARSSRHRFNMSRRI